MNNLEQIIAENIAKAVGTTETTGAKRKATTEDFNKFIVLDENDVVRVNALDIYKDADGEVTEENVRQVFALINWTLKPKGATGDKPKATKIDLGKILKK